MNVYDFTVKNNKGEDVDLSIYKGKVLLIVNTATRCGFTKQYDGLEKLYEDYNRKGLEILDFPSNQFMNQAPETDSEIQEFCTLNFNTKFPRFKKGDVNGDDANPLFTFLKEQIKEDYAATDEAKAFEKRNAERHPVENIGDIKWNFTKFLIDKIGNVAQRYSPAIKPEEIARDIEILI